MAIVTNTFSESGAAVNREELMGVVHRVAPEDTPIYSSISKGKASSVHPEWVTDELDAPGSNAQLEGDQYSYGSVDAAGRPGNYTQILRKSFIISETQQAVMNAGNVEKVRYQTLRKGIEIRKDVEWSLIAQYASADGNTRRSGGFPSWYKTNDSRGTSGADGGFATASGKTVVPTNGTQRAFSKAIMDSVMKQIYESGGNPRLVSCSPYVKSVFVTFISVAGTAEYRYAVSSGSNNSIVATADMYEGPFGKIRIMPNRVQINGASGARAAAAAAATQKARQHASNAHFIDPTMANWKWLRPIRRVPNIAKDSDAMRRVLIGEGTLCIQNEKAHGVAADLFGLSATT